MSNTNAPFGFRWLSNANGGGTPPYIQRKIDADDTTAIYRGDPTQHLDTGYVAQGAASVAISQHAGIFWGCEYLSTALGKKVFSTYWPGSDAAADPTAIIIPMAGVGPQLFMVQGTSTVFTFTDIGLNCDVDMGTGSVTGGYAKSGATLDRGTINTTATLPFRIVDLYSSIASPDANGIDDTASYNIVIVRANSLGETGL